MRGSTTDGLIKTKLFPLKISGNVVARARMTDDVMCSLDQFQVITIIGAAGSGKSILMGQLFERIQPNRLTCWLNFDDDDNHVNAFFSYFIAALQEVDLKFGVRAATMIASDLEQNIHSAFQSLCEDISEATREIAIFLDDFQFITNPLLLAGLSRFVGSLPNNVVLVLTSRSQVEIELSKRRIDGSLKEFSQLDLNFSSREAKQLMSCVHDLSLETDDIESLTSSTEGWVAGLQLAGLALKKTKRSKREVIDHFSGKDRDLNTYLMETVFSNQPEEVRRFLLETAPLGRMNAELCTSVTGIVNCEELLMYLYSENMFLIPLDRNQKWFRYHHLFSEFLIQQLEKADKGAFAKISEKASRWFSNHGLNKEAIKYLLAAGQHDQAAELIIIEGGRVAQIKGDHETILSWMGLLPKEYLDRYPQIYLNYAWTLLFTRAAHKSEQIADEIRAELVLGQASKWQLNDIELQKLKCLTDVIKAISYNARDDTTQALNLIEHALARWANADATQLSALHSSLAYTCIANVDFEKGFAAASVARVLSLQSDADYLTVWADWVSAVLCIEKGFLSDADKYLKLGQDDAGRLSGRKSHGRAMITLVKAELHCERGDMDSALVELTESTRLGAYFAPLEPMLMFYRTRARILVSQGESAEALIVLKDGQELGLVSNLPRLSVCLAAEEVKFHIRLGDLEQAISVGEKWSFRSGKSEFGTQDKRETSVSLRKEINARLLIAEEKYGAALGVLNGLILSAVKKQRGRNLIELRVLKAISLWKLQRERESMRELASATADAAPHNFRAPFLDLSSVTMDILKAMNALRSTEDTGKLLSIIKFEKTLLECMVDDVAELTPVADPLKDTEPLSDALTQREIDILELLASGLSNKQLADTLFITIPTVKWHLHNIFEKFSLRNRTAVVAKARRLKIVQ